MLKRLIPRLALRNLRSDWFGTLAAVLGVAIGTATVSVVLTLDVNTRAQESRRWETNPTMVEAPSTVGIDPIKRDAQPAVVQDAKEETHEDYQVMRSAIRLGSLSAFLVGALIVFFTFRVVVEQRRREIALLRSLGATPRQVAGIFLLSAMLVGIMGAALGVFFTPPLSAAAAMAGITTTGRSHLYWLFFPWKKIFIVAIVGAFTAVLGVASPLREVLRLDVAKTLRPQFIEGKEGAARRRPRGLTIIAFPMMVLMYVLIRPFFVEVLPSLAFFVAESGLVIAGFLSLLVLVPEVVGAVGGVVARVARVGPAAERLLTVRRIERASHEFSWAVSGIMLVFALLLGLHIVTRSLKSEVVEWGADIIRPNTYVVAMKGLPRVPDSLIGTIPQDVLTVQFSGRTPWPNTLMAVQADQLRVMAKLTNPAAYDAVKELGPGKIVLSHLMARRYGVQPGDALKVTGLTRTATLTVVGISDIGYMPVVGTYRNSKTFGLVDAADYDLLEGYAKPMGGAYAIRLTGPDWFAGPGSRFNQRDLYVEVGRYFEQYRVRETDSDFRIFDVILLLTGILAGLGIANNLVLSAHVRRREIALLRVLGMKTKQVRNLFLMEGVFIGAVGGVMAVVLGIPLGFLSLGALTVISAFEVHFALPPHYVVATILGALVISLASALYPALRASGLSSAESVHYE
ncbi:MAG: ABC transporter permease [Deltaproteobacteria bacterium]|nr:ABC transporter permease [Deltaproteobacteria bacterium]